MRQNVAKISYQFSGNVRVHKNVANIPILRYKRDA
jgi:hypothetical protein